MDVVVLVVKNKRAHLRRIQNISFCANDDGRERRESFYEVTFFDFLERGEIFFFTFLLLLILTLSSFFPSTSLKRASVSHRL